MKALTKRGFYRFIRRQPPGKRIVHSKGWCDCAVGDYARANGANSESLTFETAADVNNFSTEMLPEYLHRVLNIFGLAHRRVPTYGKLAEFISKRGRV